MTDKPEKEILIEIKRIKVLKLSKNPRADNPYQGYDTYYVILSKDNKSYQYQMNNNQVGFIVSVNESLALLESGDSISVQLMKKLNPLDLQEVNRIVKITKVVFK